MLFDDQAEERHFRELWDAVHIVRPVHYSLFTFGDSHLPYYLVCESVAADTVSITQGEVHIRRPMILTPDTAPEFLDFFETTEEEGVAEFLLARTARFSNLRFTNRKGEKKLVSDSLEEAVDKLNRRLDEEEEDHTAILTAPAHLTGVAVLKYASQRVWQSAADNIQELRERGFLPEF